MSKELKFLSGDLLGDPIEGAAYACAAVYGINKHVPDREELVKTLRVAGAEGTEEEVKKVIDLLPEHLKTGLDPA